MPVFQEGISTQTSSPRSGGPSQFLTSFALRALDEEFLNGMHFKAAAATTKMSLAAAENSNRKKRETTPSSKGGNTRRASPKNTPSQSNRHRGETPTKQIYDGGTTFKPKINSLYKVMAFNTKGNFKAVRDREQSSSRSGSTSREGVGNPRRKPSKATSASAEGRNRRFITSSNYVDPFTKDEIELGEPRRRVATNLKGEGLMKGLTGAAQPLNPSRSILKAGAASVGNLGESEQQHDSSSGVQNAAHHASRRSSNASSAHSVGLFGGVKRTQSGGSQSSFEKGIGSSRRSSNSSIHLNGRHESDGEDLLENDVEATTVKSGSSASSSSSVATSGNRKGRGYSASHKSSPVGGRPVQLTEANIKSAQRRLQQQEASTKARRGASLNKKSNPHGGENALLRKVVQSGSPLPQDSRISRMSSYASTAASSGASSTGSNTRPQHRPFKSLEEYLCEPVADRLSGYGTRKMKHKIQQKNRKELESHEMGACTFSPKLNSKSLALNVSSQTSQMKQARFRRQIMKSPPRSSEKLRRSDSVMSAAWGNGSDFMSAVRPPSEYPESQVDATRRLLKITPKARKVSRSVSDLLEWESLRQVRIQEQQEIAQRLKEDAEKREEQEVYALRERRVQRTSSNVSSNGRRRRHKPSRSKQLIANDDLHGSFSEHNNLVDDGSPRGYLDANSLLRSPRSTRTRSAKWPDAASPKRISLMAPHSVTIVKKLGSNRIPIQEYSEAEARLRSDTIVNDRKEKEAKLEVKRVADKRREEQQKMAARQRQKIERLQQQEALIALDGNAQIVEDEYIHAEAKLTVKKLALTAVSKTSTPSRQSTSSKKLGGQEGSTKDTHADDMMAHSKANAAGCDSRELKAKEVAECRERLVQLAMEKKRIAELRMKMKSSPNFSRWWLRLEQEKEAYKPSRFNELPSSIDENTANNFVQNNSLAVGVSNGSGLHSLGFAPPYLTVHSPNSSFVTSTENSIVTG